MIQDIQGRKQYPSEAITEDPKRLETQIRVFKRWLNCLLKQANAREVTDILDIFRDTKNLYYLCKYLLGQKVSTFKEPLAEDASYLDRAIAMLERLYGHEIATVMQTAVVEISSKQAWDSEAFLREPTTDASRATCHNLLLLGLDTVWIFIVTVRSGTGPPSNLVDSISSSGSTITRRSFSGHSGSQSHSVNLLSTRSPCVDRWLISQDERLMAWCVAVTEGYSGINIINFTHSWRDGLAFLAIVHQSRPDLFTYGTRLERTVNQNLSLAFHLATAEFATPRLLEPIDMHPEQVDARATATYILEFRKAVERDRKRRSRGILEIQTSAMVQDQSEAGMETTNVTVLSRASPTSSASASDTTWLDDELDNDSGEDGNTIRSLPDPDLFDSTIETTLAWLLAMEERFANNDLTHLELVVPQAVEQFSWSNYSDANFRKSLRQLNFLTTDERNDIESLLSSTTERLKKLHEKIVGRVDEAMARFEVHEDLTAHMARRQMAVGRCLRLGTRLIRICRDRQTLEDAGETGNAESSDALSEQDREYQARLREKLLHLDPEVIQRQTALLSSRWNNLCRVNQTLGRRITNCLLRRQGILLVAIRLQLEKLEEERSRQAELLFGPSIRELKNQLEVNRCLEEGIEIGEVLAARLDNFIMLVPLHNAEETERVIGLEAIITDLANRWGRLVDWVNTRYAKLQNALLHWRHFEEEYNVLTDWLNERADEASRVSAMARSSSPRMILLSRQTSLDKASNSPSHTMSRNNSFGRNHGSSSGDDSLMQGEQQELLAATEAETEAVSNYINSHEPRWAQLLASLDRRAQAVREACGDTEEVSRLVESMVERLVNRWSQLDEPEFSVDDWIDRYTRDGNDLNVSPEPEQNARMMTQEDLQKVTNHSTAQAREDFERGTIPKENKRPHEDTLTLPKGSKIPCLDTVPPPSPTGYRAEFEAKAEELLNWLENCAEALELVTMDKNGNPLDAPGGQMKVSERKVNETGATAPPENPANVINRISREVADWRETMQKVLTMGERYREELLEVGESVEELDQLFEEVEERWAYLTSLLTEAERQVRVATNSAQFHEEVSKLLSRPQEEAITSPVEVDNAAKASTEAPEVITYPAESVTEQLRSKTEQLHNQLSRVEETLQEQLVFTNPDDLEDQLLSVRKLLEDLLDEHSNLNVLLEKLDTTRNADLVSSTSAAINRLKSACASLKARLGHTQDLSEKVDFFMNQLEGIEKWLADMRDYLDSVSHAVLPSPTVIQAQMQESCEALKDMETLEPTLQKVSNIATHLQGYFREEYQKLLADRLVLLQANWDEVRELTKSNREHLETLLSSKSAETPGSQGRLTNLDALEQTTPVNKQLSLPELTVQPVSVTGAAAVHTSEPTHLQKLRVDVDDLELWMTEAKEKLAKFATVETQAELTAMENIIQTLNNEISERRYILAALDTHAAVSMTDQPLSDTVSLLTRAHFADLESAVAAERERLRGAKYYLEDFTTLMNGESRWFDSVSQLAERLKSETYADLSELAEDLESLNRLSEEHSAEDEERLNSLAKSLSVAKVMSYHVRTELEAYNKKLAATKDQMNRVQSDLKAIVDCGQRVEIKTQEWETLLLSTVRQVNAHGDSNDLTQSDSNQLAEWSSQIGGCKEFLAQIERERSQDWGAELAAKLLNEKLKQCQRKLEVTLKSIQNVLESVDRTTNLEPSLTIVKQRLLEVEKQLPLLDIISCTPDELATSTEKVKDLLTNLNELKVELDQLQKSSPSADKKSTDISEKLSSELTTLQERHRNLVMTILTALGRLEDALPLAQKLEQLVATLGNQVDSVEEVTDYLETADCPMSRKDMVQSVYKSLEKICAKDGVVGQILQTMDKLKQLTTVESSLTSSKQFKEIEKRIEGVIATKEAFHRQAEQLEANAVKHPTDSCSHTPVPALEHPMLLGIRPSVSQLIESLVKKESQTPPMLRQLAREIKDHFKSVVLFYRYCLGTNAPLPSVREEEMEVNSHISKGSDYVTTVAERKAVVQVFFRFSNKYLCQQKTHLGDRLRELIVNAGGDGIGYRLQDLLSLQNVWHETNDKLDRRGEHMATLEQQLNAAEQALSEYMACCSTAQRSKCISLLSRLEETYGWKLTADHEMLSQKTLSDAYFTDRSKKDKIWDENLVNKYEAQLRTLAQLLNASQLDLALIKRGSIVDLGAILKRSENRFIQCCQAVEATGQTLDQLKKTYNPVENTQIPMDRADPDCTSILKGDDLMWLKILLEAQKNRFDDYSSHFSFHKNVWQHRADQWDAFCSCLNNLKAVLTDFRENEDNAYPGSRQDIRRRLQYACGQFEILQKMGLGLTQTEVNEISQENGFAEPNKVLQMEPEKNYSTEKKNPPIVPPRRNSLNRGKQSSPEQDDRAFIRREVNAIRSQLQELCRRYSCLSLLVSIAADGSEAVVSETSGLGDLLVPPPTRSTAHRSAYVNVGALDDEGPPLSISTLEELGTYRNDVEACLRGLAEETHWLINSSGLVPKTLVRRKSDDIRLVTTPRAKPTTEAELCFDLLFWHGQTGSDLNGGTTRMDLLEFTPSWLKTKWAELEGLIEVTFEHEKQANAWCRKSVHLVRLLRECEGTRTKPAHGKVITRLEASCNRLSEALSLAQTALRRRKLCLTRWQSQLVELDTLLAEIKTLMGSYETTGWGITGETPSDWLADLRQKLIETSRVQDQRVNRDYWLMELDPQNSGLGNYLDALSSSWNKIQAELASTEQSAMKVQVPEHIASQIRALLTEWEMVCVALNLQPRIEQDRRYSQEDRPNSLLIMPAVAIVCAPNSWLKDHVPTEPVQSHMNRMPGTATTASSITAAESTSPTLSRIRSELEQLSRWLTAVANFSAHSRVKLGDRFDQDTMNSQLLHAKLVTSEGSRMDISQIYHPAALQLKMQQFLTELEARKPQLDRISVERDRLGAWNADESLTAELSSQAENLSELWANTEDQMQRRTLELEEIIADTQKLKDHEREFDRWLTKAEAELDLLTGSKGSGDGQVFGSARRLPLSPDTSRKRLQDLGDSLALGREKLSNYTREAESLMRRFQSEDTSKICKDLEQITDRWDQFNKRLQQTVSSGIERICEDFILESEKTLALKGQQTSSFEPRLISASSTEKLTEKLDHIDRKVNRIAQMEIDLKRQHGLLDESVNVTEQRSKLFSELQALQTEINNLSAQITGGTMLSPEDVNLLPDSEFLTRWRQLRDKVASLRQTVQTSSGQAHLFLARIKEMNNWVAHRDAAFRATMCPLSGNLLFILKLRETMLNLFKEIEGHRPQIEDVLQQGLVQFGDERGETGLGCDSELESDASDMAVHGSSQRQDSRDSTGDDQSKRVIRRIRRYLYHLRKRWLALNSNMLEYKQKLDAVSDRLSNFQSMFNDVVEQVRSAHAVALRWMPVDCLPVDRIGTELEQAQSFYEACDPLVILLNNLDRQIVQFHDSQIALDPHVITQQAALRNDFDQVRFLTEARIRALSQTLVSIQALDQRTQPQLTRSPSHRTPIEGGQYTGMDPTENFVNGKMESPVPVQAEVVPLSDSVSPPWERCVHPSGTQVPYYKNHASQDTQWDHPILSELMQSMKQMNAFRFAEYRTALKLRKLQKTLCLDSLSISILAENLKHIGHSQPVDEHNQDPFDRTINVPQMIDCLLDLFSCANGMFGLSDTQGTPVKHHTGGDWAASQQKTGASAKYSTLPSTRSSDTDTLHQSRGTPTKCGKGFRRYSSTSRDQQRTSGDPASTRPLISSPVPGSVQPTSLLTPGTRCASLPESVTFTANASPIHRTGSDKTRRSTRKGKRHFLVGPTRLPVHVCVDLTLNWLLNVYDRMRKGNVRALSFKVALTTLSVANLDEKYRYLFSLIADPNGCVTEQRLYALLCECILIPRNLGEGGWIGKEDFASTVKHCFEQVAEIARSSESASHFSPRSIPVRHFLTWLRFGPKTIIWLPLLHRIMLAEQVVHNVRCGVCQRQPLTGLRYRCLRCLNFDLCQQCFFCGWTARSHKLSHPMQEYCTNSTSGDSFRDFTRIVRNRLRSRDRGGQRPDSEQTSITTRYSRGRSTCCDANSFGEDKPRPAPTFGSDLVSLLPRDSALLDSSPFKRNDWSKGGDSIGTPDDQIVRSQAQAPGAIEPPISRPSSSQIPHSPEYRLPPRAASDTRQFQRGTLSNGTGVTGRSTFPKSQFSRLQHTNAIDIDDEHNLIAQYSNELRQQSEPDLNPVQQMVSSTHSAVPTIMDRSTISDGIPCTPVTTLGNEALPARAGHSSLDRRQLGRLTGGQPYLSYNGPQNGSLDVQPSYYPGAAYPYPLSSNPALPRMISHESHLIPNIQRSYSLRARSQPPPDVHAFRHNFGPNFDPRSPWPPASQPANYHGNNGQTVRTLEDERKLLQMEYDRLRQRTNTPTYLPSSSSSRLQTQQAQQRFARMQLQHQLMHQQQQQDPMRASLARPYLPRIPLHRPPSVGSAFPNGSLNTGQPTITGRVNYGGSLGRSKNTSNGFGYLIDSYGSEPRVGGYPYGFEAGGMDPMSTNQTAVSSELAIEARRLREHRGRLEVRMQQLEDQNKQLEHKLQRLRQYLISGGTASGAGIASGTNKIPAELLLDRINANSKTSLRQRSASGGLASQAHPVDGKAYRGSGSVGQLIGPASLEIKQAGAKTPVNLIDRFQQEEQNKITSTPQDYYQVPVDDSFPVKTSPGPQADDIHTSFHPSLLRSDSNQY
ncbi:hypothetical protein CRM22_003571 [Opisthorchis felineus]|uniref:Calponin-homology (CH) domain-containing protein n=1 Tax=Opisthorchis felineus TaxID=147828 RepID=A0A4S2M0K0_OPIFE|nr:hypothetical protein CRM22_003571 [Opisthorchis felineus]